MQNSDIGTPVSDNKKREASSPLDYTELKKTKMAEKKLNLSDDDYKEIANVLREIFRSEMATPTSKESVDIQVKAIVRGVLDGLETKVADLEAENDHLKKRVTKLEDDADAAEQYSRNYNLRISGVPEEFTPVSEKTNPWSSAKDEPTKVKARLVEDTEEKVIEIINSLDIEVRHFDFSRVHRLGKPKLEATTDERSKSDDPPKPPRPRDIIVRFTSQRARNIMYRARTSLKDAGKPGVVINEDLTRKRSELFFKARCLVKDRYIDSAWSFEGTIFVKDDKKKVHRIRNESDLLQAKSALRISKKLSNNMNHETSTSGV